MRKTKKVLSLICALSMVFTMFGVFSIAKAASDVAIVAEVVDDTTRLSDAELNGATRGVTINFSFKGLSSVNSIYFKIPVDDAFTCTAEDVTMDSKFVGALPNYAAGRKLAVLSWTSANAVTVADGETFGSIKLTAPAQLTAEKTIDLSGVEIISNVNGSDVKYTAAAENITIPTITIGKVELAQKLQNTVTINRADTSKTDIAAGDTIKVDFSLKGLSSVNSIYFKIPVDDTFTCTAEDVTMDSKFVGALPNYAAGRKLAVLSWTSANAVTVADGETFGSILLTVATPITSKKTISLDGVEIISNVNGSDVKYTAAAGNITIDDVVIDPASESGDNTDPSNPSEDTNGKVYVNGIEDSNAVIADGKATITVAAQTGKKTVVTAADAADNGNPLNVVDNGDGTYTITMSATGNAYVTVTYENESTTTVYPLKLDVQSKGNTKIGAKYIVKLVKNDASDKDVTTADIVISNYDANGVSKYYMVFNDVTVNTEYTVYVPAGTQINVNAVDNVDENSNDLGNLVADKAIQK